MHSNGISVECEFGKCRLIEISKGEVIQVFSNVIANAIDAMPQGGSLCIQISEADAEKPGLQIVIRDTGIGIPKDKQSTMFKKFYQVDASHRRKHSGTGLGLVICKGIIEGLGGKIWFESEPGKSTSFYFSIPLEVYYKNRLA